MQSPKIPSVPLSMLIRAYLKKLQLILHKCKDVIKCWCKISPSTSHDSKYCSFSTYFSGFTLILSELKFFPKFL